MKTGMFLLYRKIREKTYDNIEHCAAFGAMLMTLF